MIRRLTRWLTPLALAAVVAAAAHAQAPSAPPSGDTAEGKTSVLSYALAGFFTLATLVILCAPSRKS